MAIEDSTLLPGTDDPVGQAPLSGDVTKGLAYNYSEHLDRIVTALEQLSISMAEISANVSTITNNSSTLIQHTDQISTVLTTTDTTILADNIQILSTKISEMQTLASSSGIHTIGPYEWLAYSSILQLYEEQGIDIASLKARVDALPKTDGY